MLSKWPVYHINREKLCACVFSIPLTMVTIRQTGLIKAASFTQYLLLTFNQIFLWSFDNVSYVQGVGVEKKEDTHMKEEYELVE